MTPGRNAAGSASRRAVLSVLCAVEFGARSDRALDRTLRRGSLPPRDRRLVTEIVYGVLRRQGTLDRTLAPLCARPLEQLDVPVRAALRAALYQAAALRSVPPHAAIDATVGALRSAGHRGAGFVNGVLRAWLRAGGRLAADDGSLAQRYDVPQWLAERWRSRYGQKAAEMWFAAAARPAPAAVRVHERRATRAQARALLEGAGLTVKDSPWHAHALRLCGGAALPPELVDAGIVTPRSEASQAVTALLRVNGALVLDACAGRGGKAVQLAEQGARRVLACDVDAGVLRACRGAAGRAGTPEVVCVAADMTRPALRGCARAILVDAPCTGLGTIRRHPEIRWRVRPRDLARSAARSRAILSATASLLAPGGTLLYLTCTTEPEENEQVVAAALAADAGLTTVPVAASGRLAAAVGDDGFLRTFPHEPELDGFFAALLRRRRGPGARAR